MPSIVKSAVSESPVFIELWCNGNTSDFGSEILGSSPDSSTNSSAARLAGIMGTPIGAEELKSCNRLSVFGFLRRHTCKRDTHPVDLAV